MTTKATADWLSATVTSDLGVTCQKSMPAFDRPDIVPGAYIGLRTSEPEYTVRVGSSSVINKWEVSLDLLVITANELALWAMIDLMEAMAEARTAATISGNDVSIIFVTIERAANEFGIDALRYAATTTIQFVR